MNNMAFNPVGGLTDSSAYPTYPASEAALRAAVQDPSNQLRDFMNTNVVPNLNSFLGGSFPSTANVATVKLHYDLSAGNSSFVIQRPSFGGNAISGIIILASSMEIFAVYAVSFGTNFGAYSALLTKARYNPALDITLTTANESSYSTDENHNGVTVNVTNAPTGANMDIHFLRI